MRAHRHRTVSAALLAVLFLTAASCEDLGDAQDKGTPKGSTPARTPSATGKTGGTAPSRTPQKSPSPKDGSSPSPTRSHTGQIQARFVNPPPDFKSGKVSVNCTEIKADITLQAAGSTAAWEAVALDHDPGSRREYPAGNVVRGVTFEPSSGVLPLGQQKVLRVRGSFRSTQGRQEFFVMLRDPNGAEIVHFACPGA